MSPANSKPRPIDELIARLEALAVRLDARNARDDFGIDTTQPGWGDEYQRLMVEERARQDESIATPHVADAIAGMEQQFS